MPRKSTIYGEGIDTPSLRGNRADAIAKIIRGKDRQFAAAKPSLAMAKCIEEDFYWINRLARAAVYIASGWRHVLIQATRVNPFLASSTLQRSLNLSCNTICRCVGRRAGNELRDCLAAFKVGISIALVIGPTPPGTGVIALDFLIFVKRDVADQSVTTIGRRVIQTHKFFFSQTFNADGDIEQ